MSLILSTGFTPHVQQQQIISGMRRRSVLVCHRRFGKTVLGVNALINDAAQNTREEPQYVYAAPLLKQAKKIAWRYMLRFTRAIPKIRKNESELYVELPHNGARVFVAGADNPDSWRGLYLDGLMLDEYAQMHPSLYQEVVIPALADRDGWCCFSGTPKGHNQFYDQFQRSRENPEHYTCVFKASETGIIPQRVLDEARAEQSPEIYAQEWECDWEAAIPGAYWAQDIKEAEADGRITKLPLEKGVPVDTYWDIGVDDFTAIWLVQQVGLQIRLIDYIEGQGLGIDHYANVLRERARNDNGTLRYSYGEHYGPHDIKVREWGAGARTRIEQAAEYGIHFQVVPKIAPIEGINAVRKLWPRIWIDREKCKVGLEALKLYRQEYNEDLRVFTGKPVHDWTSHPSDALRQMGVTLWEKRVEAQQQTFSQGMQEYDPFMHSSRA